MPLTLYNTRRFKIFHTFQRTSILKFSDLVHAPLTRLKTNPNCDSSLTLHPQNCNATATLPHADTRFHAILTLTTNNMNFLPVYVRVRHWCKVLGEGMCDRELHTDDKFNALRSCVTRIIQTITAAMCVHLRPAEIEGSVR